LSKRLTQRQLPDLCTLLRIPANSVVMEGIAIHPFWMTQAETNADDSFPARSLS
jgi:hypothetical protein